MTCPHPEFCKAVAHAYKRKTCWTSIHGNISNSGIEPPVQMFPGTLFINCRVEKAKPEFIISNNQVINFKGITVKRDKMKSRADLSWAILGCIGLLVVVLGLLSRHV